MNLSDSEPLREISVSLRRSAIWYLAKVSYFAEAGVVLIGGVLALSGLYVLKIGGPSDWAAYAVSFALIAGAVFVTRRLGHQNAILIEATLSYLLNGGRHLLDELLGKLISGRWRREQLKPGDALFQVLEKICYTKDWQLKRRIAEALPALGEIDRQKALSIAEALRYDWDDRWHSDLRRRVLEALVIPSFTGATPLIDRMRQQQLKSLLVLRDRDQIYVAIAAAEAICKLPRTDRPFAEALREDLLTYATNHYPPNESDALRAAFELLDLTKSNQPDATAKRLVELSKSGDAIVRVVAARNVLVISERFPDATLDLMQNFLADDQPRNVRRPIAKEQCVRFVAAMSKIAAHREKAEALLVKLVTDADEIIRVTAFDLVELMRDQPALYEKLCAVVVEKESGPGGSQELLERATRLRRPARPAEEQSRS